MEGETHSRVINGKRQIFITQRLWTLAKGLPVRVVEIAEIAEFDQDCWFRGVAPTCRQVADHARRIQAADLRYPVILSSSGALMDGGHRIAKAWSAGATTVKAVRFAVDPEPDYVVPDHDQLSGMNDREVIAARPAAENSLSGSVSL